MYKLNFCRLLGVAILLGSLTAALCCMWQGISAGQTLSLYSGNPRIESQLGAEAGDSTGNANTVLARARIVVRGSGSAEFSQPAIVLENEDLFRAAQERGKKLLSFIANPSKAGTQRDSRFKDVKELQEWGYKTVTDTDPYNHMREAMQQDLRQCLVDKGFSLDEHMSIDYQITHTADTYHPAVDSKRREILDGEGRPTMTRYPATGGNYNNMLSPKQGFIFAENNYSPAYERKKMRTLKTWSPEDAPLPELQKWSDVVFLAWMQAANRENQRGLKYILRFNIYFGDTHVMIRDALRKAGLTTPLSRWPHGIVVNEPQKTSSQADREAFEALVGNPNVMGVAWLLIQHADDLGKKTIKSITVWQMPYTEFSPCVLIELRDRTFNEKLLRRPLPPKFSQSSADRAVLPQVS